MDWLDDSRLSGTQRERKQVRGPEGRYYDAVYCCMCGYGPVAIVSPHALQVRFLCRRCETFGIPPVGWDPNANGEVLEVATDEIRRQILER